MKKKSNSYSYIYIYSKSSLFAASLSAFSVIRENMFCDTPQYSRHIVSVIREEGCLVKTPRATRLRATRHGNNTCAVRQLMWIWFRKLDGSPCLLPFIKLRNNLNYLRQFKNIYPQVSPLYSNCTSFYCINIV